MILRLFRRRVKRTRPAVPVHVPRGRTPEGYEPYVPDDLGTFPRHADPLLMSRTNPARETTGGAS